MAPAANHRPAFGARMISAVGGLFESIGNARAMSAEFGRLSRMSDAGLARRGLARGDIATYVGRKYLG